MVIITVKPALVREPLRLLDLSNRSYYTSLFPYKKAECCTARFLVHREHQLRRTKDGVRAPETDPLRRQGGTGKEGGHGAEGHRAANGMLSSDAKRALGVGL